MIREKTLKINPNDKTISDKLLDIVERCDVIIKEVATKKKRFTIRYTFKNNYNEC